MSVPVFGSTLKPRDSRITTPIKTLFIASEIKTGVTPSLSLICMRASPCINFILPPAASTSTWVMGVIPNLSASCFGRTVRVAPVSTNAFTFSDLFLSKSDIETSIHECPIRIS